MTERPGAVDPGGRLAQLESLWPGRVSWARVREVDPRVFRQAAQGAGLVVLAVPVTLLWAALNLEWPAPIELPSWIEWVRPLSTVVCFFVAILLWLFGWIMISMPLDTKRGIAFSDFAARVGLTYSRFGFASPTLGIFFAERLPGRKDPAKVRPPAGAMPPKPLFRTEFVLWSGRNGLEPKLQLGKASFQGDKSDPKGPRNGFRYLSLRLPRALPHLVIDARGNGSLRSLLPGSQRVSLEGDFDRYFTVYVPEGYERDALELLTPDVMACLIDHGRRWDIEVIDDTLQLASTRLRAASDRRETTALLYFAELIGEELGHQAKTYSDPRASRPRMQVAPQGRRLRRRSGVWSGVLIGVGVVFMFTYPFVLGWWLDR
ncbi:hypothetical protein ACIFOC_01857 [Leucobacter aridicollis]|uniref:hypothetical protein n=1 Tax=Leucobacter aridicollis TaxID=283878 RepID=UPI0037C69EFF